MNNWLSINGLEVKLARHHVFIPNFSLVLLKDSHIVSEPSKNRAVLFKVPCHTTVNGIKRSCAKLKNLLPNMKLQLEESFTYSSSGQIESNAELAKIILFGSMYGSGKHAPPIRFNTDPKPLPVPVAPSNVAIDIKPLLVQALKMGVLLSPIGLSKYFPCRDSVLTIVGSERMPDNIWIEQLKREYHKEEKNPAELEVAIELI